MKAVNDNKNETKGLYRYFKSPVVGIMDIALVMAIITLAVFFLGPVIIQPLTQVREQENAIVEMPERDYLIDESGNVYGRIDIEYHENGAFRQITEHNERDNQIVKVFYSEHNEFLYWIEIQLDESGDILYEMKFDADGHILSN